MGKTFKEAVILKMWLGLKFYTSKLVLTNQETKLTLWLTQFWSYLRCAKLSKAPKTISGIKK